MSKPERLVVKLVVMDLLHAMRNFSIAVMPNASHREHINTTWEEHKKSLARAFSAWDELDGN